MQVIIKNETNIRLSILFISLFSLVLISCGGNKKADNDAATTDTTTEMADTDQVITEKYWKLIKLEGQDVEMVEKSGA